MALQLTRDRIQDVPWKNEPAKAFLSLVHSPQHHDELLRYKLMEEVAEFLHATRGPDLMEEAADILEVLRTILERAGLDPDSLDDIRRDKKRERGGFALGITWGDVE